MLLKLLSETLTNDSDRHREGKLRVGIWGVGVAADASSMYSMYVMYKPKSIITGWAAPLCACIEEMDGWIDG